MQTAYIALGSNLGDRLMWLQLAVARLAKITHELRCSPVYEGTAHTLHPSDHFPDFLNAVVEIQTDFDKLELLDYCQEIERKAKRQRHLPYGPRTLDLDILTLGEISCKTPRIILPHPRLQERRFVLQPWCDLAPNYHISSPVDTTVATALARCEDQASLVQTSLSIKSSASGHHTFRSPVV